MKKVILVSPPPVKTIACLHDNHGNCDRGDERCSCTCHPWMKPHDFKPDWDTEAVKRRFEAREAAHQAVKAFDLAPNIQNTTAAIEALSEYEQHLKEENDGEVAQP